MLQFAEMKKIIAGFLLLPLLGLAQESPEPKLDEKTAERFARLALACVDKEYPNKISHNLNSDADVAPPRKLTPAFYGCYDWHSSVHGHWLLARLARTVPDAPFATKARAGPAPRIHAPNPTPETATPPPGGPTRRDRAHLAAEAGRDRLRVEIGDGRRPGSPFQ